MKPPEKSESVPSAECQCSQQHYNLRERSALHKLTSIQELSNRNAIRQYLHVGLLGGEAEVFFMLDVVVTGEAAVVLGAAGLLFTLVRGVVADADFDSEVRFSVLLASATW